METIEQLVITRTYNAPRELVYKAWTDAEALAQWWAPTGMSLTVKKLDFRPGGIFHYRQVLPNGEPLWGIFIYRDMKEPEYINFVNSFSDEDGNRVRSPFHQAWPLEILNEVSFEENDEKTTLTLKGRPINATEEEIRLFVANRASMNGGFKGLLDKLEEYLAN